MGRHNNLIKYVTPQTEIVEFQPENSFLGITSNRALLLVLLFEDSGVEDGGELL